MHYDGSFLPRRVSRKLTGIFHVCRSELYLSFAEERHYRSKAGKVAGAQNPGPFKNGLSFRLVWLALL
jgi:hypothetical protein